ncbi:uncharacterized protein PRCAT00000968001 [Priceomyces carsonii]|uniref:uncharacterized protein n=1 Tax=Priceomyces carsonii TaxID=28549 RepID=UPI002ED7BEEA|nr:unnamed protein product [Priceomyces carsonii]
METDDILKMKFNQNTPHMSIEKVYGTSLKMSNHFDVQGNYIAYTASGGVVLCEIDFVTTGIIRQRFFCANNNSNFNGVSPNSANAYLNMAYPDLNKSGSVLPTKKDQYGYAMYSEPLIITGNENNVNVKKNMNDVADNELSPSKLKDRVRSVTCLKISPNKRLLAVGESGYQPRILIFSLASDLTCSPIAMIYEHSFGINSIQFSPDLKYFCSLGLINDGFLNVWKIVSNTFTLHSSNKCSSIINRVIWHENFIITLGVRLIKVWKHNTESAATKPNILKGKNVVLGPLLNANFVFGEVLNDAELIIGTSDNQLLLLNLDYNNLKLISLDSPNLEFKSMSIDYEDEKIWFGSKDDKFESIKIFSLKPSTNLSSSKSFIEEEKCTFKSPFKSVQSNYSFSLNKQFIIFISEMGEILLMDKSSKLTSPLIPSLFKDLLGAKVCSLGDLLFFSRQGKIKKLILSNDNFENIMDFNLPSTEILSNALTAIEFDGLNMVLGDRFGQIYIIELSESTQYQISFQTKAHSSSVNDIQCFKIGNTSFAVSISRDRMIQVFCKITNEWELLQTIPIHTGNLLKVLYHDRRIYISSSDRTISIHAFEIHNNEVKITQEKIIATKSAPINMNIFGNDFVVSTNDKNILIYKINEGLEYKRSLKLTSEKANDTLLVEHFVLYNGLIVLSASDKSLRIFDFNNGNLMSTVWGHLESILNLIRLPENNIVSISADGCMFKWSLFESSNLASSIQSQHSDNEESTPLQAKVTRKILLSSPFRSTHFKQNDNEDTLLSPLSPSPKVSSSPRLSKATLKRIEAKKLSAFEKGSSIPERLQPPISNLSPSPGNKLKTATASLSRSPSRSPLRSPLRKNSSETTKINLTGSQNTNKKDFDAYMKTLISLEKFLKTSLLSQQSRELMASQMNSIIALLDADDLLTSNFEKMTVSDNHSLKRDLKSDNSEYSEEEILNRLGDKLISIFERKIEQRVFQPLSLNSIHEPKQSIKKTLNLDEID